MPTSVSAENCYIILIDEAKVPAQEPGAIEQLLVKEGQAVKKGEQLIQLDDSIPKQQLNVAVAELAAAKEQADNPIPTEFARASLKVAQAALMVSHAANRKVPGTVPQVNIDKLTLECTQMKLSIDKAVMDTNIAIKQMEVKEAQKVAAETALEHRRVCSPLDGQVREIFRHVGEWAQTGEPIVHVVRMDRLYIQGWVNLSQASPSEVAGKPVAIKVHLARERTATVQGSIVFVDPMIQADGLYMVRAEVENQQDSTGQWMIHPGMQSAMTIQLK